MTRDDITADNWQQVAIDLFERFRATIDPATDVLQTEADQVRYQAGMIAMHATSLAEFIQRHHAKFRWPSTITAGAKIADIMIGLAVLVHKLEVDYEGAIVRQLQASLGDVVKAENRASSSPADVSRGCWQPASEPPPDQPGSDAPQNLTPNQ